MRQIEKLDKLIENKMIEKEQWKAIAFNVTARTEGERVKSSGNPQKMSDAIDRYIDIEREINESIDKLVDTKQDIINVIEQLDTEEYDLLHKVYVQHKELVDVADAYGKSYSWSTTVHGTALKKVQKILDAREKEYA